MQFKEVSVRIIGNADLHAGHDLYAMNVAGRQSIFDAGDIVVVRDGNDLQASVTRSRDQSRW